MDAAATIRITGTPSDRLIYVLAGSAEAGGRPLAARSSVIVEYGARLDIRAGADGATLLVFHCSQREAADRPGGHVHILPSEHVPRTDCFHGSTEVGGGLHGDAHCPTCSVWLHEQMFMAPHKETALHSHSEDEVIFVTGGCIRLGNRDYGPGTALFVAANAKYAFHSGADGLTFINFRGSSPTYTAADGSMVLDEAQLWRSELGAPPYLEPVA